MSSRPGAGEGPRSPVPRMELEPVLAAMKRHGPRSAAEEAGSTVRYDHVFKVVMVGESGVGKTSLAQRFAVGVSPSTLPSTIGVDFSVRIVRKGDKRIKVQLWDTSGQETMREIVPSYFRYADAIIVVYDSTDIASFQKLPQWMKAVEDFAEQGSRRFVMSTKCDMEELRAVSSKTAQDFAKSKNVKLFETSAMNGMCVEEAFLCLVKDMEEHVGEMRRDFLTLRPAPPPPPPPQRRSRCC